MSPTPRTLLLLNIGNSDLTADDKKPAPARAEGKGLWETYTEHTFKLPIIEPCLQLLLKAPTSRIDHLVLFDTDQPARGAALEKDRHGITLRDKDTIWFGKIIERWITEHYSDRIGLIERRDLSTFNPSLYDEAFDAYGYQLATLYDPAIDVCAVLMAGGIPACNNALHLQSISRFGERCRTIYQPDGGEPYQLRTGAQVLKAFRQASAIDALERRDFAAAYALISEAFTPALKALVGYAQARESFDFDQAQSLLEHGIEASSGEVRHFLLSIRHDLDDLVERERVDLLLGELYTSARITYQNERYADFLGRMFRFQEATLRYIVELLCGLPTDMSNAKRSTNMPLWQAGIDANPRLRAYLDAVCINGNKLKYSEPHIPVLAAIFAYTTDEKHGLRADGTPYLAKANRERYREAHKRLGRTKNLSDLRNSCIVAHGFRGVSKREIEEAYGEGNPVEDMLKILELLKIERPSQRLNEIADFAIEQLRGGA
jgi:hypothetical protein